MLLALALGTTNAIDMPTRQAFVIEMVGREDIGNAVALNSAIFNAARIVGPAVAGLTIGVFDISTAFLINGLSFVAVIASLLAMRPSELHAVALDRDAADRRTPSSSTLAEGLGYVRRTHVVLLGVSVVGLVSLVGMNFSVVDPGAGPTTCSAPDADGLRLPHGRFGRRLAGGRARHRVPRATDPALSSSAAPSSSACSRSRWRSRTRWPLSLVCMFGIGAGGIAMAMTANTAIQLTVPDQLRGRVMAVYTTVFAGSTPIGGLAFGAIAAVAGIERRSSWAASRRSSSGSAPGSSPGAGACSVGRDRQSGRPCNGTTPWTGASPAM